jgi:hypothetical protein
MWLIFKAACVFMPVTERSVDAPTEALPPRKLVADKN